MIVEYQLTELGREYYTEQDLKPKTIGSAGIDLRVVQEPLYIIDPDKGAYYSSRLGIKVFIKDPNYVGLVFPRSSSMLRMTNSVGVIDADYQGEIMLRTLNGHTFKVGDRVAQLIIVPVQQVTMQLVEQFSRDTARGSNGLGSTGI